MIEFDIQRFEDESYNAAQVEESNNDETSTEAMKDKPPIPDELAGLPEDLAREAMKEAESTDESKLDEPVTEGREDQSVDELTSLKAQIEEYQRRYGDLNSQPNQTVTSSHPQLQQSPPSVQPPQLRFTPEVVSMLKQAVDNEAMKITGYSPDVIKSFEFADDDDPRVESWKYARQMATDNVFGAIRQAQMNQAAQVQHLINQQSANIRSYNEFTAREMKEPDFAQVQNYAVNEYFNALEPQDQFTIRSAYMRIEHQTAEPTDIMLIKNYFKQAQAEYRGVSRRQSSLNAKSKSPLPRVDQISGTTTAGEPTISDLEKLLDETEDPEKLPEKYRKLLAGY